MSAEKIEKKALVIYKNQPALVLDFSETGKYTIQFRVSAKTATKPAVFSTQSVREKDFIVLQNKAVSSLEKVYSYLDSDNFKEKCNCQIQEAYELLSSDSETSNSPLDFEELAFLCKSDFSPDESWAIFVLLKDSVYFNLTVAENKIEFTPRSEEDVKSLEKKAYEKEHEQEIRAEFLNRLKKKQLLPEDSKFMSDVEALALGKTDKSRTMNDLKLSQSPEKAHRLLLETGIWAITRNPYPIRWGFSMQSASQSLSSPPEEERVELSCTAWAIDNEWSTDPDDAVAFDGEYLWVHIADPASVVCPDSLIDKTARDRGCTLYLPEGASRMLSEDSLADYALGLSEKSRALSFRLKLSEDASVEECAVFKTLVNVKRLTYQKADELKDSAELKPLFDIAEKNVIRRTKAGAVQIQIPEIHISVDENKKVSIEPEIHPKSSEMIREMMLLAGEGAARFAFKEKIAFPFVSQEASSIPNDLPEGLAGQFRLRRCMRKRSVGVTPSMHCGLGLGFYSQVTSPLRRYSDLIAHEQLRAFLDNKELLDKDTMLFRISQGDAASQAARKVERKSDTHWTLVFLLQNPSWTGEAICVDKSGKIPQFFIPSIGMEMFMKPNCAVDLNQSVQVKVSKINLPDLLVDFIPA